MKNHVILLFALIFLNTVNCSRALADNRGLTYNSIHVEMTIQKDTSIDVVETQDVEFNGDWNGLYRDYNMTGCDSLDILGVSENGKDYQYGNIADKGGYILEKAKNGALRVKWRSRDANEAPYNYQKTSFVIKYRISGAIGQYRNRDVLYWKPIFSDRQYPVSMGSVAVILPEASG